MVRRALVCAVLAAGMASAASAQDDSASYVDETARTLHEAAMAARERVDDSVLKYTAVVRQRLGVSLRTPLKDRTLFRRESAHRLFWSRDADNLIQVLALRAQTPVGLVIEEELEEDLGLFTEGFDPMNDRLLFGMAPRDESLGDPDDDEFWVEHPLYEEFIESYRFISGDTLTLSIPDGRQVIAIELQVIPKVSTVNRLSGSLWIEPETGSLVRAVYRLADQFDAFRDIPDLREEEDDDLRFVPGIFKPWTADIRIIAVDYALWDFEVWLPRSMRMEGVVAAGIVKVPMSMDFSYEMEAVTTEQSLALPLGDDGTPTVHFRTRSEAMAYLNELAFGEGVELSAGVAWDYREEGRTRYFAPEDVNVLLESPELPPPIWSDAPGFTSEEELTEMFSGLADLPMAPVPQVPATLRWGLQRPDLFRYNRVEALSLGARGQLRPQTFLGPLTVTGTARLGVADLEPNARVDLTRETLRRKWTLGAYSELAAIDEGGRHLGLGNTLMAMFFGRDDGDYYRRAGASLELAPPTAGRQSYRLTGYAEYHRSVDAATADFALFRAFSSGFAFRPNLLAGEGWEYGAQLKLTPWWGTDPFLTQGGLDVTLQAATGDFEYARSALEGTLIVPLPSRFRLGLEAGAGTSWGTPSPQRLWYVGGSRTLRGYDPTIRGGADYWRGRAELARFYPFGAVSLFSDVGWAGDWTTRDFDAQGLYSIGVGVSVLDGLIRMDSSYGLKQPRGFRFDLYLDGIL